MNVRYPLLLLACGCLSFAHARVGEVITAIDARITASGTGVRYPKHDIEPKKEKTRDTPPIAQAYTEDLGNVTRPDGGNIVSPIKVLEMIPPSMNADVAFFLKSDDGHATGINVASMRNWSPGARVTEKDNPVLFKALKDLRMSFTGWELMVIHANGTSVLEIYRRIGNYVTPAEMEGLLKLNGGARVWKPVPKEKRADSLFIYEYETEDGQLRARTFAAGTNVTAVMIFNGPMGERLREVQAGQKQEYLNKRGATLTQSLDRF